MKKRVLIMVLGVLLVASLAGAVTLKPPEEEKTEVFSQEVEPKGTAYLIAFSSAMIKNEGNRWVTIGAWTYTTDYVEYVSGRVYLQRWDGNKWVNIDSRLFYRFNHFFACGEKSIKVSPGQYRAHSIHYAEHNGVSHTMFVTTSSRYIY